jgi:hypothetical protein
MADRDRISQTNVTHFCSHANCDVVLKTTYIYPADIMPETPPRINQRSCSHYFTCSLQDKSACVYAVEEINHPQIKFVKSGR